MIRMSPAKPSSRQDISGGDSLELICFEVEPGRVELLPSSTSRAWMDDTPGRHVYRCLPITMASSHGWEMLCPIDFEVRWNGGDGLDAIEIEYAEQPVTTSQASLTYLAHLLGEKAAPGLAQQPPERAGLVQSHFGSGILTFNPLVVLRTAPGYNLWVSGPVNRFKDAIQPISALIETDWMPFTFSMNWKITRPDTTIAFRKGEPFCSFFPVPRGVVDACTPVMKPLGDDPDLEKAYWAARLERNVASGAGTEDKDRLQSWYARGVVPGTGDSGRDTPPRPSNPKKFTA